MKQGYLQVLKLPQYRKVLAANFIDRLGDAIDMIAFTWLTYQITQSASWSAVTFAVNMLPPILFLPFTGALVEKLNKKHVIIICDILRGLCTAWTLLLYLRHSLNIVWLLSMTFLNNTFECFRIPSAAALLPQLLNKDQYDYGLSLHTSVVNMTELIGIAFSGMILATVDIQGAIFIDMCSFFLCGAIYATLHLQKQIPPSQTLSLSSYRQTLKEGIRYVKASQLLKTLLCCCVLCNALLVPLNTYQAAFTSGTLHLDAEAYSAFSFSLSLGICIGSFLLPYLHKKFSTRHLFLYSAQMLTIYYIAMSSAIWIPTDIIVLYLCLISSVCGIGLGIACNVCGISMMKTIDPEYLSRVNSLSNSFSRAAMPIISLLLSFLSMFLSISQIFCIFAVFTFLIFTGMMFLDVLRQLP